MNSAKRKAKKAKDKEKLQRRAERIQAQRDERMCAPPNELTIAKVVDDSLVYMNISGATDYSPALLLAPEFMRMYCLPRLDASCQTPSQLGYGWQVCLYMGVADTTDKYLLTKARPLRVKEKLRLHKLTPMRNVWDAVVEVSTATVSVHKGVLARNSFLFRWMPDGEMQGFGEIRPNTEIMHVPGVSAYMAAALKRTWTVAVSYQDTLGSVLLPTDATGVGAMFRTRDVQPGKTRRDALLTWVSEHWRQNRYDPDEDVRVRQHLRGCREFDWQGMHCQVSPSHLDQALNETLAAQKKLTGSERRRIE